jgi:peptidoglycan hydrolase-like protein with peptidoglycan-binding domain
MVQALLAAERAPGWKRKESAVQAWQRARGLTQDGKFGPGSGLKLALELGTIPIIRFWPNSAGARPDLALADYRGALELIAQAATPERALLLRASAERETGQSFGAPQGNNGKLPITNGFEGIV